MSEGAVFAYGVTIGVIAVGVAVYLGAPAIARRTTTRAIAGALSRTPIPADIAAPFATMAGELAAEQAREALFT